MGEIADMMIDGTLDWQTGEYIGPGYGFPRNYNDKGRKLKYRPNANSGVKKYLVGKGITSGEKRMEIMRAFFPDEDLRNTPKDQIAIRISQDFGKFIAHVKTYL